VRRVLSARSGALTDVLGLGALLLLLLDYLRPSLLLLETWTAGGDTPCHVPTAAFACQIFSEGRLHGWYPGAYLGHPLLLYYFPLPFLVMVALAPLTGLPVAFKLGTVLGVFLLPLAAYACARLMRYAFPVPLVTAAAALVFVFLEENPIWGGNLASTLTGEFSYTYGTALALVFLGVVYRAFTGDAGPAWPAATLAVVALAHGYAVLWAGLSAAFFLFSARDPLRAFRWLLALAALALALAGVFLVPLLTAWGWTTPYDDPWITVTSRNLFPPLLWPLFGAAVAGLGVTLVSLWRTRRAGEDATRLLFLLYAAATGAALAAAGPVLGIIDIRFVPFAQLGVCLVGGVSIGHGLTRLARPGLAALALVLVAGLFADQQSKVLRAWIDWNYTGLESKELWPAFRAMTSRLPGTVGDPRVAIEYGTVHEKAGSIRMYETFPFFSGRSTVEGVYNQASLQTHPVYYLASELGASSPNPFRKREYSTFDTDNALRHLRLFNVGDVVAVSTRLTESLAAREDVLEVARVPPYTIFRLADRGTGYVEPLAFAPVRSPLRNFRDKAYRWFTRKPQGAVHLVFTDDPRFSLQETDEWLAPPAVALPGGVRVQERVEAERISITTDRPGHPLLVKVSYHPRWKAVGAHGPYLVSPALMLVVPYAREVQLVYARNWADHLGLALTAGGLASAAALAIRGRRRGGRPRADAPEAASGRGLRLLRVVPAVLLAALFVSRLLVRQESAGDPGSLYELASRAYAAERWAEAAEYARHAIPRATGSPLRPELLCLRGESLLRAGDPGAAVIAFETVANEAARSPYVPQALFGLAAAQAAVGDASGSERSRRRLLDDFPETPWARRTSAAPPATVPPTQ
jgi:hypothetical protein